MENVEYLEELLDDVTGDIIDIVCYTLGVEVEESAEMLNLKQNIAYILTEDFLTSEACVGCLRERLRQGEC